MFNIVFDLLCFIKFQFQQYNEISLFQYSYKSVLYLAVEKGNLDIIKLLLARPELDVNVQSILINFFINFVFKKNIFF